jgi:hypothetical protein
MLFARVSHDVLFKNAVPSDFPKEYRHYPYGNLWLFRSQIQKTAREFQQLELLYKKKGPEVLSTVCSPFLGLLCFQKFCKNEALEGAHVTFFDGRRRKSLFIVPLCRQCNAFENAAFYLRPDAPLLKVMGKSKKHKKGQLVPRVKCTVPFLRHTQAFSLPCDPNDIDF